MPNFHTSQWFILTPQHIALLRCLTLVQYNSEGFGVDSIRPFGNSDIHGDIGDILARAQCTIQGKEDETEYQHLYEEMIVVMQITLQTSEMKSGVYYRDNPVHDNWSRFPFEVPLPALTYMARSILALLLAIKHENDVCIVKKLDLANALRVVHAAFSTQFPGTKYVEAIEQLLHAEVIVETNDSTYRLLGFPKSK